MSEGTPAGIAIAEVLADVELGFVSRPSAELDYGVVLDGTGAAGLTVDAEATAALRRGRRDGVA